MVTSGGDIGGESEFIETGRRKGEASGGRRRAVELSGVPDCGEPARGPATGHGDGRLGRSRDPRDGPDPSASLAVCTGTSILERARGEGGLNVPVALPSNIDLSDDTGLCDNPSLARHQRSWGLQSNIP